MLTDFGKALRIIRVNRDISAKDMANNLGISPSYLSAIENGKRAIPDNFLSTLLNLYNLSQHEIEQLNLGIKQTDTMKLDMTELSDKKRKLVLALAQSDLDDTKIDNIFKMTEIEN